MHPLESRPSGADFRLLAEETFDDPVDRSRALRARDSHFRVVLRVVRTSARPRPRLARLPHVARALSAACRVASARRGARGLRARKHHKTRVALVASLRPHGSRGATSVATRTTVARKRGLKDK